MRVAASAYRVAQSWRAVAGGIRLSRGPHGLRLPALRHRESCTRATTILAYADSAGGAVPGVHDTLPVPPRNSPTIRCGAGSRRCFGSPATFLSCRSCCERRPWPSRPADSSMRRIAGAWRSSPGWPHARPRRRCKAPLTLRIASASRSGPFRGVPSLTGASPARAGDLATLHHRACSTQSPSPESATSASSSSLSRRRGLAHRAATRSLGGAGGLVWRRPRRQVRESRRTPSTCAITAIAYDGLHLVHEATHIADHLVEPVLDVARR